MRCFGDYMMVKDSAGGEKGFDRRSELGGVALAAREVDYDGRKLQSRKVAAPGFDEFDDLIDGVIGRGRSQRLKFNENLPLAR